MYIVLYLPLPAVSAIAYYTTTIANRQMNELRTHTAFVWDFIKHLLFASKAY